MEGQRAGAIALTFQGRPLALEEHGQLRGYELASIE